MPQLRTILFIGCLFAVIPASHAQSLSNSSWRTFYPPLNDTVTLHFKDDSLTITTTTGAHVLKSTYKLSSDNLITFKDYGGMSGCPDMPGKYHINLSGGYLSFTMDEDPCNGRGGSLIGKKWLRVAP